MSDISPNGPRTGLMAALFTDHPKTVNETYFGHMRFAMTFAFWCAVAACAALVHAFVPALCETTASRIFKRLNAKMTARH